RDHGDHISLGGVVVSGGGVALDRKTGKRYARRIGERQIVLGGQRLGRSDFELAGRSAPMKLQRFFFRDPNDGLIHACRSDNQAAILRGVPFPVKAGASGTRGSDGFGLAPAGRRPRRGGGRFRLGLRRRPDFPVGGFLRETQGLEARGLGGVEIPKPHALALELLLALRQFREFVVGVLGRGLNLVAFR